MSHFGTFTMGCCITLVLTSCRRLLRGLRSEWAIKNAKNTVTHMPNGYWNPIRPNLCNFTTPPTLGKTSRCPRVLSQEQLAIGETDTEYSLIRVFCCVLNERPLFFLQHSMGFRHVAARKFLRAHAAKETKVLVGLFAAIRCKKHQGLLWVGETRHLKARIGTAFRTTSDKASAPNPL